MAAEPTAVAVYIDWQNVYKAARTAFSLHSMPNEHGNFSPYQLARILAAGNGRGANGNLVRVEVHRGLPNSGRDPVGYGANRRQAAAWMKENPEVVIPRLRPLRYPRNPDEPPVEKGVDVQLGIAAFEHVLTSRCEIAIIFSHDTDLLPVVEAIARVKGPACVETAAWSGEHFQSRLRPKVQQGRVYHHNIPVGVFNRVATPVNYAYGS